MDGIDISVIVPVYNLEHFLMPLLKTIKAQDLGDYKAEYIFILNNCTDDSERVIRDSELVCKILTCSERGCGPSRNVGYEAASGKYIWYMDGDDWLLSNTAIRQVLDKAISEDLDILRIPFASDLYRQNCFAMVWQYLLRRTFVSEFRFPSIQPAEDDAYMEMVLAKAGLDRYRYFQLPHIDKPLYFYNYLREGSNMYRYKILREKI